MLKHLGYWILRRVLKYSAPTLRFLGNKNMEIYSREKNTFQPVFIVGPPRSGSTILYQLITNYLDVLYVDNLMNMSREAPLFGAWLSNKMYGDSSHNSFESNHGKTLKSGLHAPNEGLFWYNWLPKDTHYVSKGQIDKKSVREMQDIVYSMMNRYEKPMVFKNLSFSMRLEFLKEVFPQAKIIYIKRDPIFVAQSLYIARKKAGAPINDVWGIIPKEKDMLKDFSEIEMVVKQIWFINKQINNDLKLFPKEQIMLLNYEDMVNLPQLLSLLKDFTKSNDRKNIDIPNLKISNKQMLESNVYDMLNKEIVKLDWEYYN